MPDGELPFARLRLSGPRFEGGRLPVDALGEIQRYQALVLAAARGAWISDHPDEDLPENFDEGLKLAISDIEPGSAQVLLEREAISRPEVEDVFSEARDEISRELASILDLSQPIAQAPLFQLKDFQALGSSLVAGEALEVTTYARDLTPVAPIRLSSEERSVGFDLRIKEVERERRKRNRQALHTTQQSVAGRLVALNAQKQTFRLLSLHFGELPGSYNSPDLTASLKAVLNTSAKAPVVRVQGDLQFRNGDAWRVKDASDVELLEIDGQPWSRKLVELASLGPDWDGEWPGASMVSFAALEAARDIVLAIVERGSDRPSIFPTEEGGVSLEWASSRSVTTIEIVPDADRYELYHLPEGERTGAFEETRDFGRAVEFASEVGQR